MSLPTEHSEAEARGDWSNLKGTEYHLVYAIHELLHDEGSSLAFYQGNDLVQRSKIPPPALDGDAESHPPVSLGLSAGDADIWVQLKATSSPWTRGKLFEENLLINFIYNSFHSEQQSRTWQVRLITQGEVRRAKYQEFVNNPEGFAELNSKLKAVIAEAQAGLRGAGFSESSTTEEKIKEKALSIISSLAQTVPVRLETLRAEVELMLAYSYPDPKTVRQIAQTLVGAMLLDAAAGPTAARDYDAQWLNEAAGVQVVRRGLLDSDPAAACSEAIRRVTPSDWDSALFTDRQGLNNAISDFIEAPETVFVLLGASGAGKSWAIANCSLSSLKGKLRLVFPGTDLDHHRTLAELTANRLQSQTTANWAPEQFLQRLVAASQVIGSGGSGGRRMPLIFFIDDLRAPAGGVEVFRRDLARLVESCKEIGAKILIACQPQMWEVYKLGADINPLDIFSPVTELGTGRRVFSFALGDLSADEQEEILRRRFGLERGKRAAARLRAAGFTPLRIPYYLTRYLEQHGDTLTQGRGNLPVVTVDELLDERINTLIEGWALSLGLTAEDVQPALDALINELWRSRPHGLTRAQVLSCFEPHLHTQSIAALNSLRLQGLLSTDARINIAEQPVLERLFAKRLGSALQNEDAETVLRELRVEDDANVASTFIRGVAGDPVSWAETFLRRDQLWGDAVLNGLAQCDSDDYRILAFLFVFPRSHRVKGGNPDLAFGQLAARSARAWKWAAEMYLAADVASKRRGERLLAPAMEFVPHKVEAAIRLRLSRVAAVEDSSIFDREKKKQKIIEGSLDVLRLVNHREAAETARRIIDRYDHLIGTDEEDRIGGINYGFEEDVDYARGLVALFGGDTELEVLKGELGATDDRTRYRAAWAILSVAKVRPELVSEAICSAIQRETNPGVLNRLLLAAYYLIRPSPDDLIDALRDCAVIRWDSYSPNAGLMLTLLGNLAGERPEQIHRLLPTPPLRAYDGWNRAFLNEMLVYAWWRCAEHVPGARSQLLQLATPELSEVELEFRPFAWRGAALAQLALISLDKLPAEELTGRQVFYPLWQRQFLFLDAAEFVGRHSEAILADPRHSFFKRLLLRCLNEQERVQVHVQQNPLLQARYACAGLSLDMLVEMARVADDPFQILQAMPQDWQVVRAVNHLFEAGLQSPQLVEFARRVSAPPTGVTSLTADSERDILRAHLARLEPNPRDALEQHRGNVGHPFLPNSGQVHTLAELSGRNPDQLLALLEDSIRSPEDLSTLYHLESAVDSWQGLLIARVFRRMFYSEPISIREARELCEQMLAGVRALPPSPQKNNYEELYTAIGAALNGTSPPEVDVPTHDSVIQQSHALAASILQAIRTKMAAQGGQPQPLTNHTVSAGASEARPFLNDRRGWFYTEGYQLKDGIFSSGFGLHMVYFLPSVRLALRALGPLVNGSDIASEFTKERVATYELIKRHRSLLEHPEHQNEAEVRRILGILDNRASQTPDDERLFYWRGNLLLHLRQLSEAVDVLSRCATSPLSDDRTKASAFYNLACAYALQGDIGNCHDALLRSNALHPLNREHAKADPDLEPVKEEAWFQSLVGGAGQSGEAGAASDTENSQS